MSRRKSYGLILPSSVASKNRVIRSALVFDDDDDDEDSQSSLKNQSQKKDEKKTVLKRQIQLQMEKAMADDPTVYEYDSIYDDLQFAKASSDSRLSSKSDRKPKYIDNLMKAAEDRKKEMERRTERKIHKERQAEHGKYDDKEAFVTDAYRQKMEQMRREEENEQRKEQLEAMMDVTKQSDLSGFYRSLLKQTVGEDTNNTSTAVVASRKETSSDDEVANSRERGHLDILAWQRNKSDNIERRDCEKSFRDKNRMVVSDKVKTVDTSRLAGSSSGSNVGDGYRGKFCEIGDQQERLIDRNYEDASGTLDRDVKDFKTGHAAYGVPPLKERPSSRSDRSKKLGDEIRDSYDDVSKEKRTKTAERVSRSDSKMPYLNIVKRTTGGCLEDARARFLARKAAMKVPFTKDD